MSRILLDPSAYSAFMVGHPDLRDPVRLASAVHLNAVVVGELLAAFKKGKRGRQNRAQLRAFVATPRVSVLHVDEETAERYAVIKEYLRAQGTPVPTNDLWIAATAVQYGLRLITLDAHFLRIPHVIVDFIETAPPAG